MCNGDRNEILKYTVHCKREQTDSALVSSTSVLEGRRQLNMKRMSLTVTKNNHIYPEIFYPAKLSANYEKKLRPPQTYKFPANYLLTWQETTERCALSR